MEIYSYIVKYDYGLAPNPFWGELTLNVCKPKIRCAAEEGDWVIVTGSKNVKQKNGGFKDYSGKLVYAMKIGKKMTMEEYDKYCNQYLTKKIPYNSRIDWRKIVGDSLYDYSVEPVPRLKKVLHKEKHKKVDLSGKWTLLSKNFYYFGNEAKITPPEFTSMIRDGIGHLTERDEVLIKKFVKWLTETFEVNKLYGDPQLKWQMEKELLGECEISCDE